MSKPWERDDDFVMYLNSGDQGTHALEPGVTTVRSAFRQELEIPLTLSQDWQVALFSMYYTHSFGNAVLKSPDDYHCQVGRLGSRRPLRSVQLPHLGNALSNKTFEDFPRQSQVNKQDLRCLLARHAY
jgi:hypothetical protein